MTHAPLYVLEMDRQSGGCKSVSGASEECKTQRTSDGRGVDRNEISWTILSTGLLLSRSWSLSVAKEERVYAKTSDCFAAVYGTTTTTSCMVRQYALHFYKEGDPETRRYDSNSK